MKVAVVLGALFTTSCYEPSGLNYQEPVVGRVVIEADSVMVEVGKEVVVNVSVYDQSGRPMPRSLAQWNTADRRVATVVEGVVKGVTVGRTTLGASAGGVSTGVRVRVDPAQ